MHGAPRGEQEQALPEEVNLHAPSPNPVRGQTVIRFDLPEAASVHIAVHDLLGREVLRVVEGERAAGYHRVMLDGA